MKKRVVIIGMGDTGVLAATRLAKHYDITAISTKPCLLSGQELGLRLSRTSYWQHFYQHGLKSFKALSNINVIHGSASAIDPDRKHVTVATADNRELDLAYDALLIASGTRNGFWRSNTVQDNHTINQLLESQANHFSKAHTIAVIGAGPTGVSTAYNLKREYPQKDIHLFISQKFVLPGYHNNTRAYIQGMLYSEGIHLHTECRAKTDGHNIMEPGTGRIQLNDGSSFDADAILWAIGNTQPNNAFIPQQFLDQDGFVLVDEWLRVQGSDAIFSVGDIAATDPNRSSARNAGFVLAARNIHAYLSGKKRKMETFTAPEHRWGSILGIQNDGMDIFTPKGKRIHINRFLTEKLIFATIVEKFIYKGIYKKKLTDQDTGRS